MSNIHWVDITIVLLTLVFTLGVAVCADNTKTVFSDVDASTALGTAIYKLVRAGVINGFEDGSFMPEGKLTRAQTAKMLCYIVDNKAVEE